MKQKTLSLQISGLAHDLCGVARHEEKACFVAGALPGEQVTVSEPLLRAGRMEATLLAVETASPMRIVPACRYAGECGGCDLQHLSHVGQLEAKQHVLAEQLRKLGGVVPQTWLPPLVSEPWGYRRRARLACHLQTDERGRRRLRVGLRAASSQQIVEIDQCLVLEPQLDRLLQPLRTLLAGWSEPRQIGHVELLATSRGVDCLFRLMSEPSVEDTASLCAWAQQQQTGVVIQCGDVAARRLVGDERLYCEDSDAQLFCRAGDFVQGNAGVNRQLIASVIEALQPQADDRLLEAFCGLGNFTLPLASRVGHVQALELSQAMLDRARQAAAAQGITHIGWQQADLDDYRPGRAAREAGCRKILLDPPRAGAQAFCEQVPLASVQRIVYVSCNPATLARDAGILQQRGFALQAVQLVDMFPQTRHIESLAVFVPAAGKRSGERVEAKAKTLRTLGARVPKGRRPA